MNTAVTTSTAAALEALQEILQWLAVRCAWWWALALAVFSVKFVSAAFDRETSYGKLRPAAMVSRGVLHRGCAFVAFYCVGLVALVVAAALLGRGEGFAALAGDLGCVVFAGHVSLRLLECLWVHRFSPTERVPLTSVVAGIGFYGLAAVTVAHTAVAERDAAARTPAAHGAIAAVCALLRAAQAYHHYRLALLRQTSPPLAASLIRNPRAVLGTPPVQSPAEAAPTPRTYALPTGGAFSLLACPHYASEIAMYALLAAAYTSPPYTLMAVFVALNLVDASAKSRRWYQEKFGVVRYALVPYLW